jgi:hypothetical protein
MKNDFLHLNDFTRRKFRDDFRKKAKNFNLL